MKDLNTFNQAPLTYDFLKAKQRAERDTYKGDIGLRIHRSLSWLHKSEQVDDLDSKFIFLWISLNAAYGNKIDSQNLTEKQMFSKFIKKVCSLDKSNSLFSIILNNAEQYEAIYKNKFLHSGFWAFDDQIEAETRWNASINNQLPHIVNAIEKQNSAFLIREIFYKLYILRNQLMHGLSTYSSSTNREQMTYGVSLLSQLVPALINILMSNTNRHWEAAAYPVIH